MDNKKILLSIIIPSFNSELTIENTLESIKAQCSVDYEVILVDGGSVDRTIEIFRSYFPTSVVISEPDRGIPDALNKGFALAKGDFFCWLNTDDNYNNKFALRNAFEEVKGLRNVDWLVGHSVCFNVDENHRNLLVAWIPSRSRNDGTNIFTGSIFFSKRAWDDFGEFNIEYKVAFEYQLIKFLVERKNGKIIQSVIADFNVSSRSVSINNQERMMQEKQMIFGQPKRKNGITHLIERIIWYTVQGSIVFFIREKLFNNKCRF